MYRRGIGRHLESSTTPVIRAIASALSGKAEMSLKDIGNAAKAA